MIDNLTKTDKGAVAKPTALLLCRGLTPPPAPLRPARRGAGYCPVVCGVWWWFGSCGAIRHPLPPFMATEGLDLHHGWHLRGRKIPRNPLAPAPFRLGALLTV